jgi:DNA-binding CsgD family transcriptional regulator
MVLLHKKYADRQSFFVLNFYNNPHIINDSVRFFSAAKTIEDLARKNHDRELELEAPYMRLNFLSGRNYKNYIPEIKKLMQIADNERIKQLQIRTRQALGFHYFYERQDYGNALYWFLKSAEYLQNIDEKEFPEKQETYSNIANICFNTDYENKALKFLKEAQKYHYEYAANLSLNILNTEALILTKNGKNKEAAQVFKTIIAQAVRQKSTDWQLIASGNLAALYLDDKQYGEALSVLNSIKDMSVAAEDEAVSLLQFAEVYLHKNEIGLFNKTMEQFIYRSELIPTKLLNKQNFFYLLHHYYRLNGDFKKSVECADSSIVLQEKIDKIRLANSAKIAIEQDNYEKLLAKDNQIQHEKIKRNKTIFYSLGGLILLLIFAGIFYRRKRELHQIELAENKRKIAEKEQEINHAKQFLEHFKEDIVKKDKIIRELTLNISHENKKSLLGMVILTEDDWILFKREFSALHPHFFYDLKAINPDITPALERLAALYRIGLDNSQIANVLGINKDSVSKTNRRLKQQLNIPQEMGFVEWFEKNSKEQV